MAILIAAWHTGPTVIVRRPFALIRFSTDDDEAGDGPPQRISRLESDIGSPDSSPAVWTSLHVMSVTAVSNGGAPVRFLTAFQNTKAVETTSDDPSPEEVTGIVDNTEKPGLPLSTWLVHGVIRDTDCSAVQGKAGDRLPRRDRCALVGLGGCDGTASIGTGRPAHLPDTGLFLPILSANVPATRPERQARPRAVGRPHPEPPVEVAKIRH